MSEILNRLKQAERERERVVAERRRLETEADAALGAREREELGRRIDADPAPVAPAASRSAAPAPVRGAWRWGLAGLAIGLAVSFVMRFEGTPAQKDTAAASPGKSELILDRDVEGFAARAREKEKQ